jgi:hypothetical protein
MMAMVWKIQGSISDSRSGLSTACPRRPFSNAAQAKPNGMVMPT